MFIDIGLDSIHYQYSSKKNSSEFFGTFFFIKLILIIINIAIALILVAALQLWWSNFFFLVLFLLFDKILVQIVQIFLVNLKTKIKIFKAELPSFFIALGKSISIIYLGLNLFIFADALLYLCISNFIFDSVYIILILLLSKINLKLKNQESNLL